MKTFTTDALARIAREFGSGVPGLADELESRLLPAGGFDAEAPHRVLETVVNGRVGGLDLDDEDEDDESSDERIVALNAGARPVARIRNNQVTTEFLGPDSESWAAAILAAKPLIDRAIPAVGRIELNNSDFPWAGTGWLVADGIVVTNRHVADVFARIDRSSAAFVFRPGLVGGRMSSDIDFLEEENRLDSAEHPITSILWIAPADEADVAFLRVSRAAGGPPLPQPIELADEIADDSPIGAIGYPARDPSIRDQALVIAIFGDDVYEKKRFAPGRVMSVDGNRLKHDCSTLGGNSGSVLLDLATGAAVGLHHGGLVNDSANLAVTAAHVRSLLATALRREAPGTGVVVPALPAPAIGTPIAVPGAPGTFRLTLHVPVEITVSVGAPVQIAAPGGAPGAVVGSIETAVDIARRQFGADPQVLRIRPGYRFKNGWITDERVVVFEVREKLSFGELQRAGQTPFPRDVLGVGVDVRTAALPEQLLAIGVDVTVPERPGKPAGYKEPPGHKNPDSPMFLGRVKERMSAIFHVSPDAGFANLTPFLERVEKTLTATMYEWDPNHVSDALAAAIKPAGRTLRMVTQKRGVREREATERAVGDMKQRLGDTKFRHVWASVRGPKRLIPDSYHIKVASRDGEEVWLSSGNWKESNQPKTATSAAVLRSRNREWHAIVRNKRLATLFQKYIEYDFRQATKFPIEDSEAPGLPDIELFVPESAFAIVDEKVPGVTYKDQLVITDAELDIQPLLTPDRDADGDRLFLKTATALISRATRTLYVQNQSFSFTESNNAEFDRFFTVLRDKQRAIPDVRIIFRDAAEFGGAAEIADQQALLERLKDFGFDVSPDAVRLQARCHTKGIIVDAKEVLLGSQNLTNGGSLFNRDASLLVRSAPVAKFFEKIFRFDWDNLTHNDANEKVGGIRRALPGEETPNGFRRVRLSDLLAED